MFVMFGSAQPSQGTPAAAATRMNNPTTQRVIKKAARKLKR